MNGIHRRRDRRGLTLVELLVTITILVILVGVTIPLMRSLRNGSQLEAAGRKIESLMNTAKAQALTNGRGAGIVFVRDELAPSVSYEVALAETPEPYAGEVPGSRARVGLYGVELRFPSADSFRETTDAFRADGYLSAYGYVRPLRLRESTKNGQDGDEMFSQTRWFIRPGDRIQLDYKAGKSYEIVELPPGQQAGYVIKISEPLPREFIGNWIEFQILRAPRRTSAAPVELPQGAYVKLSSSGATVDRSGVRLDMNRRLFSQGDVMISFDENGRFDRVFRGVPNLTDQEFLQDQVSAGYDLDNVAKDTTFGVTGPVRIDLGDGSPLKATNAQRLLLGNRADRNSKSIDALDLAPPLAVVN